MKKIILIIFINFLFSIFYTSADEYKNFIEEGILLFKEKKFQESISSFEKAKKEMPSNSDPYYYLGKCYFEIGDVENALLNYQKAIELNKDIPEYHYSLGILFLTSGENEKALNEFNEVVKLSPQSYSAKLALKQKQKIEEKTKEEKQIEEWEQKNREEEEKKKREKEKVVTEKKGVEGEKISSEIKKESVETLLKKLKFGTETPRKNASISLLSYETTELTPFITQFIPLLEKEKNIETRKNIIRIIGKVGTKEATETLLNILDNSWELFEYKLVALQSLGDIKEKEVISHLRNILSELVDKRVQQRKEAKEKLEEVEEKINSLKEEEENLKSDIEELNQKKGEINSKLGTGMGEFPGGGLVPVPDMASKSQIKKEDREKLKSQLKEIEEKIKENNEKLISIQQKKEKLEEKKRKYLALLSRTIKKTDSSEIPQIGGIQQVELSEEEKNEQTFGLTLIKVLGKLKDTESLSIIKKAWDEYGTSNEEIYYGLALAQLKDYSCMEMLLERLRMDYPSGEQKDELILRANIIEVIGEYLQTNPDDAQELIELIKFLNTEAEYPEIKDASSNVLSTLTKSTKGKQ